MSQKKRSQKTITDLTEAQEPPFGESSNCYEKDRLDDLLGKIKSSIELENDSRGAIPEKIWIKQQFAIGINDVTRVLERMMPHEGLGVHSTEKPGDVGFRRAPLVPLQVVIIAADCNPRWLTKHIPTLAASRQVPVVFVKDSKRASLRLGELVKIKTALAIGVKVRGSKINRTIDEILSSIVASTEDNFEGVE